MKNLILSATLIFASTNVLICQQDTLIPYTPEILTGTYEALTDWSPLNVDPMWDVPIVPLNLQFDFPCFGDTAVAPGIRLTDIGGGIEIIMTDGDFHLLSATTCSISDVLNVEKSDSTIVDGSFHRYVTEGESPNRIYKLEFNNVGFDYEMSITQSAPSTANFQIWLYENGMIEYHYGPNTITDLSAIDFWPKQTAGISSYWNFYDFMANFMWASGDPQEPDFPLFYDVEYDSLNISLVYDGWNAWPSDGTIYRFNYIYSPVINVNEFVKVGFDLNIFPNPVNDEFTIYSEGVLYCLGDQYILKIIDSSGREVHTTEFYGEVRIDVKGWPSGIYTAIMNGYTPKKIVVN